MCAVGEICGGKIMCLEGSNICRENSAALGGSGSSRVARGVGNECEWMTLTTSVVQNCREISVSRNNGGRKKMRQLVALGTRTSWTTEIWRCHRVAGKVVLECVEALLMCQEATRGADDESCDRMRIGRPCTVDAWGVVVNGTQFGSVRV